MLYLDATELVENPGRSLRRVAKFMEVPAVIDENNFYFDEEKGNWDRLVNLSLTTKLFIKIFCFLNQLESESQWFLAILNPAAADEND